MAADEQSHEKEPRPWLGILFECCRVYSRIHLNKDRSAYVGWCPRCGAKIEIAIGPDGTAERFFRAR